ncbi:ketoacyl-ACP synthase III [Longispora sp. NPDC051575]|uniref:ketoacyl-ACP synthase III n=1 Tax=Longispora sp. NPDC051575 TaxID=3154943 RepID=UPI003427572C
MSASLAAPEAVIRGVGAHRPLRVVDNPEIAERIGVPAGWIESHTGITQRRHTAGGETLETMAVAAGTNALIAADVPAADVDCLILASQTHLTQTPPLAPLVAHRLGAHAAGVFDLKAACAGFCLGLAAARDQIRAGTSRHVLVIAAEHISPITDPTDRDTAMIFADGAGAVLVTAAEESGVGPVVWGSQGALIDALVSRPGWLDMIADPGLGHSVLVMNGKDLTRWVLRHSPAIVEAALSASGLTLTDLAAFVPHQANMRIIDMLVERLAIPDTVAVARDIAVTGNTSAASIPLALAALLHQGGTKPGDLALLMAYGAGVTYAAQVIAVPAAVRTTGGQP